MKLLWKLSIPQVVIVLALGLVSYTVILSSFEELRDRYVVSTMDAQYKRVFDDVDKAARHAKEMASVFARLPEVRQAYAIAHQGNINDERAPQAQAAREMLRRELSPMLVSYKDIAGQRLQLHFHLPNGRSLVRLWRDKQSKRNGQWLDISDDISSFRQTVLDVNRSGAPVGGIELGRGGFAIRGVVPVKGENGEQLGSVEVLESFAPILDNARDANSDLALYMNADKLSITTKMQDQTKFPHLGGAFVRAVGANDKALESALTPDFLQSGKKDTVRNMTEMLALGAAPVLDYRGQQIGVLVSGVKLNGIAAMVSRADTTLILMLVGMALCPVVIVLFILRKFVTAPIRGITSKICDIAEDRADLSEQLQNTQRDEIGELARSFNTLTAKLGSMISEMEGYVNVLNTVPDPIFVVDDDYRLQMANKAMLDFIGLSEQDLKNCKCSEKMDTPVCGTAECPIEMVKRIGGKAEAETIELRRGGKIIYIKPSATILHDSHGKPTGYVEVARVVTDLVESENEVQAKLERISEVNAETRAASQQLALSTGEMQSEFSGAQDAIAAQQERLQETVAAMEQMNAAVQQVAQGATEAAEQSLAAREQATDGAVIVDEAVAAILRVSEQAHKLKDSMYGLGEQAKGIGAVLGVISDIADQTNLLALNAAIEAARAGDAGRGFAVVADEVRKLAEKTMQATKEVEQSIASIQNGAQESITAVDNAGEMVDEASTLANKSGEALKSIVELVTASSDQVQSIAAAAEEQSMTSDHISRAVDEVARQATDVSARMSESGRSVQELAGLATRLEELSAD